jgi:hypothetical protein
MKNILKKGSPFKLSMLGHNNFHYPSENLYHATKDMAYSPVAWVGSQGLNPVKVLTEDIDNDFIKSSHAKFSIIWVSV